MLFSSASPIGMLTKQQGFQRIYVLFPYHSSLYGFGSEVGQQTESKVHIVFNIHKISQVSRLHTVFDIQVLDIQ